MMTKKPALQKMRVFECYGFLGAAGAFGVSLNQ